MKSFNYMKILVSENSAVEKSFLSIYPLTVTHI